MLLQSQALRTAVKQTYGVRSQCRCCSNPSITLARRPSRFDASSHRTRRKVTFTMQNRVFVLDKNKQPLMPCHPARARTLLAKGKAAVFRRYPFTIILKHRAGGELQPTAAKFDPGAKTTGMAVTVTGEKMTRVVWAAQLEHRGFRIKKLLTQRSGVRRSRRHRKTRYRKPRFLNRTRPRGWLPPSLQSRVDNLASWATKLQQFSPVSSFSMELVRFDMQKLEHPEISGVEYQQGELFGYEVREYLLEKYNRTCVYCGAQQVPLQVEHLLPRSRGGSNRVSNLAMACRPCNQKKGAQTVSEFGFPALEVQAKKPLRDAAAVNDTRVATLEMLKQRGLPVEVGTGGRTKYNRNKQGYPKSHWLDAACVGESGANVLADPQMQLLHIKAMGRGSRQMCRVNKHGFPRTSAKSQKRVEGFQTGDMVKAQVPRGKKKGRYEGRVVVRASGRFDVKTKEGKVGVGYKHCTIVQKQDGYTYGIGVSYHTKTASL